MKPYIIAETAYNHEGSAKELINMTVDVYKLGLDAIKFHLMLDVDSYITKDHELNKKYKEWKLSKRQWKSIIDKSLDLDLDVVALCDDVESIRFINNNYDTNDKVSIELHATSLNDYYMQKELENYAGKVILGVGGCFIDSISNAVRKLKQSKHNRDIVLMYGFQVYPTDYSLVNLSKMQKLKDIFGLKVGYADHTAYDDPNNIYISALAASMGFNILEKHYTRYEGEPRIDYHAAVGYNKMKQIKKRMELTLKVHGGDTIAMSNKEREIYGVIGPMRKAIVARNDIKEGQIITYDDLWFKRTKETSNLKQRDIHRIVGFKAKCNIKKDSVIKINDIDITDTKYDYGVGD